MAGENVEDQSEPGAGLHRDEVGGLLPDHDASCFEPNHVRDLQAQCGHLSSTSLKRLTFWAATETTCLSEGREEHTLKQQHKVQEPHSPIHALIPTTTTGSTTFGYQRALLNRLRTTEVACNIVPDVISHKPTFTFIHDTLMFPGSLANLLGKASAEDLIPRMTPALLAGFHAHIDLATMQPILVASSRPEDVVQGMVVFGLAKEARDIIREYYRRFAHRRRAQVEIDVCVKTAIDDQTSPDDHWHIERRVIRAYVWFRKSLADCELAAKDSKCANWRLDDYLEGRLTPREHLRIDPDGKGDEAEDGYIGRDIVEYESEPEEEERDVVYGGAGLLDYQRASYNTGW